MNFEDQVLGYAGSRAGDPYVWGGKGLELFDKVKGLVSSPWSGPVFDCSGFVTWAMKMAGMKDRRGTHSAQVMADEFPAGNFLRFYGNDPKSITHVAILVFERNGRAYILEAGGGDGSTTNPTVARARGACVRFKWETRKDYLFSRGLPAI